MVKKIPPPPMFTSPEFQAFNRWLLEVTSILSNDGGINPSEVSGLPTLFTQVAINTTDIGTLETSTGNLGADIIALQGEIDTINGEITTINGQLTSLGARSQVLNGIVDPAAGLGNVNDWYANTAGAAGHRIFVKTGAATWTAFPF